MARREWELLETKLNYSAGDDELDLHFSKFVEAQAQETGGDEEEDGEAEDNQRNNEDDDEGDVCPSSRSTRKRIRNPEILNETPSMPKVTASEQDSMTMVTPTKTTRATESSGDPKASEKQSSSHNDENHHAEMENIEYSAYAAAPEQGAQEPFQPGSIPKEHATVGMGGTKWRYLAWTPEVRVISITDTAGNHRLEIAFTDINRGRLVYLFLLVARLWYDLILLFAAQYVLWMTLAMR